MAVVYGRCADIVGPFNDTEYIVTMLNRVGTVSRSIKSHIIFSPNFSLFFVRPLTTPLLVCYVVFLTFY